MSQDRLPKMIRVAYAVELDMDAAERKLNLLHDNIRKYGTIYNTIAAGTELFGRSAAPRRYRRTGDRPSGNPLRRGYP